MSGAGSGEWLVRVVALLLVGMLGWYLWTAPWPFAATPERPLLFEKGVYLGREDPPLAPSTAEALRQRAQGQTF
jgi:hypothetical protein